METTSIDNAWSSEVAEGDAFLPDDAGSSREALPATKVPGRPQFQLWHDPARYTVMEDRVIPQFAELSWMPGVGGVDAVYDRDGKFIRSNVGLARSSWQDRHRTPIDYDWVPPFQHHLHGNGGKSYLWRPKGRPDLFLTIWTDVFPGSAQIRCNTAAYLEWIAWLESSGKIKPPAMWVLEKLLTDARDRMEGLVERLEARGFDSSKIDTQADARFRVITVLERALRARAEAAPPKPAEGEAAEMDDGSGDQPGPNATTEAPKTARRGGR